MALTRRRTRAPSMIMIGVLGVLSLSIYWFGLPMPIVLGLLVPVYSLFSRFSNFSGR